MFRVQGLEAIGKNNVCDCIHVYTKTETRLQNCVDVSVALLQRVYSNCMGLGAPRRKKTCGTLMKTRTPVIAHLELCGMFL